MYYVLMSTLSIHSMPCHVLDEFFVLKTCPRLSLARVNLKPLSPQPLTTTRPLLNIPLSSNLMTSTTLKTVQGAKEGWWRGPRCFLTPDSLCQPSQTPKLLRIKINEGGSARIWISCKRIHTYCTVYTYYLKFVVGNVSFCKVNRLLEKVWRGKAALRCTIICLRGHICPCFLLLLCLNSPVCSSNIYKYSNFQMFYQKI